MGCHRAVRSLRLAVLVFSSLACALVALLWARSYRGEERASGHYSKSTGVRLYSSRGWLVCSKNTAQQYPWALDLGRNYWLDPNGDRLRFQIPGEFFRGAAFASISLPHVSLIAICAALAAAAWPRKSYRFSL
jgi:hypothetical protein